MRKLFFIIFFISITNSGFAQNSWNLIQTFTGELRCVVFKDSLNGFLGSGSKVLRTTDGGFTWTELDIQNLNTSISKIIFYNNNFGIGVGGSGTIIVSTDGGDNWITKNIGDSENLKSVCVTSNGSLFICSYGNKIYKSVDGGNNWNPQVTPAYILSDIAFTDDNIGFGVGLYNTSIKTTDGGQNWFQISPIIQDRSMFAIKFVDQLTGYVIGGSEITKTTDGGSSWNPKYNAGGTQLNDITTFGETIAWVVGTNKILKTDNSGESWTQQTFSPYHYLYSTNCINSLICFAIGGEGSLYKTTDGGGATSVGDNWQELNVNNSGLTSNRITTMIQDANNNYWFGSSDKGLFKYDGENWSTFDSSNSPIHSPISSLTIDLNGHLWIGTTYAFIGSINYSAQGLLCFNGNTWKEFDISNSGLLSDTIYKLVIDKSNNLWIVTSLGLQKYNGTTWKTYNFTKGLTPIDDVIETIAVDSSNNILCGTRRFMVNPPGIYESGQLIHLIDSVYSTFDVPSFSHVTSLTIDTTGTVWIGMPQYFISGNLTGGGIAAYNNGVFSHYSYSTGEIPSDWITGVAIDKDNSIWASSNLMRLWNGYGRGGLVHYDRQSWTRYDSSNSPMNTENLDWVYIDKKGNKFCGSHLGIYIFNENGVNITNVSSESHSIPVYYLLEQNYPNPFNPSTKIKFSVPKSDIVQIKVYDILGKEVTTLLIEYKQVGTYEVEFEASNLSSGVYFYRMISGSYSETKKMILLR